MKRLLITICGRAGSKGFKNKNLKTFCGLPLVYYTLSAAQLFIQSRPDLTVDICLNTDSQLLADLVAKKYPEVVYLPRPEALGGDTVPKMAVFHDCLNRMEERAGQKYDAVMDLDITSPLRTAQDIANAVALKEEREDLDLVFSVTEARRNPYFNMVRDCGDHVEKVIESPYTARQQAPAIYDLNASIYVFRRDFLAGNTSGILWEGKIGVSTMMDTGILDIDSEEDFALMEVIADHLYRNYPAFAQVQENVRTGECPPMNTRQRRQGVFCALLSAVIFGTMPLAASVFYERGGNADSLVFYRNFLALPFLFLLMRRESCAPLGVKRLLSLALLAFFNTVTPLLLFNSYNSIPTGMATTLHFSYPIFVLLGAALFCGERITLLKALCVGLCTLGVALFYSPGQSVALIGMVIAFVSGITYAAYVVYLDKSGLKGLPPFQMAFWTCLFASAFAGSYSLWQGRMRASFSLPVWGLLAGFAVMVSVISLVLFQLGVKKIGPSQASVFSTFEPLASILWGVTLLGERFTLRTGLGVGAILAAVLLLALKGDAEKSPAQESSAR